MQKSENIKNKTELGGGGGGILLILWGPKWIWKKIFTCK